jgi:hypothetical protein
MMCRCVAAPWDPLVMPPSFCVLEWNLCPLLSCYCREAGLRLGRPSYLPRRTGRSLCRRRGLLRPRLPGAWLGGEEQEGLRRTATRTKLASSTSPISGGCSPKQAAARSSQEGHSATCSPLRRLALQRLEMGGAGQEQRHRATRASSCASQASQSAWRRTAKPSQRTLSRWVMTLLIARFLTVRARKA